MRPWRLACALAAILAGFTAAADDAAFRPDSARSVSGQFIISTAPDGQPYLRRPNTGTNSDFLRLDAPWLAVSAERFKSALWREIGLPGNAVWSGKIFVVLRPAHSLDEPAAISAQPFLRVWDYRVEMPDVVSRARFLRTLSAVLLAEMANRNVPATNRSAEIPDWLADGLARQAVAADRTGILLSAPDKNVKSVAVTRAGVAVMPEGIAQTRLSSDQRGFDPLAGARQVLQDAPALTFDELSWPTGAQLDGQDGGVYFASAQLFTAGLLGLENGPAKLRDLLARLPACENWQSAFFAAFRQDFRRPLDVEKWWSLRVFAFAARIPGPRWPAAASRARLDAVLAVPVEIRNASNALPAHAEISLQAAIQNLGPAQRAAVLQTKLRDLGLVQLRLAAPFNGLAAGYREVLAEFLGEARRKIPGGKSVAAGKPDTKSVLKRLDALDAKRRAAGARLDAQSPRPPGQ